MNKKIDALATALLEEAVKTKTRCFVVVLEPTGQPDEFAPNLLSSIGGKHILDIMRAILANPNQSLREINDKGMVN